MNRTCDLTDEQASAPASDALARLYGEAFATYASVALFNRVRLACPTVGHALAIAEPLRVEGDLAARALAERMEAEVRRNLSGYAGGIVAAY